MTHSPSIQAGHKVLHFVPKPSYSKVGKNKVVRLKYALFELQGDDEHILEYRDDLYYLHGGYGSLLDKVEAVLEGAEVGNKVDIAVGPQDGFGKYDPSLRFAAPFEVFPEEAQNVGTRLEGQAEDGNSMDFTVVAVDNGMITVDGNHPYAGKTLKFVIEVLDIRASTKQERTLGYALKDLKQN